MKKPRHRVFDYLPRFYQPDLDEKERKKKKSWIFCSAEKNPEKEKSHFVDYTYSDDYLYIPEN
jgi:hypothetical protein